MSSAFEKLGLAEDATAEEVKLRWRQLSMQHHPDRGGDKDIFYELNQAYEQAYRLASEPKQCATCKGSGKVVAVSGWSTITVWCMNCGGRGTLEN